MPSSGIEHEETVHSPSSSDSPPPRSVAGLLIAGCTQEQEGDEAPVAEEAVEAPAVETTMPAMVPVSLMPVEDSGVSGEVFLADEGGTTQIHATFSGLAQGDEVHGDVHRGTCESLAAGTSTLGQFGPMLLGPDGTATATFDVPLSELSTGDYSITIHRGDGGAHIACADFTGMTS